MNKHDFVRKVAKDTGFTIGDVTKVIDCTVDNIIAIIKAGDNVQLIGLGEFSGKLRPTYIARNPKTEERKEVKEHIEPKFKMSMKLKREMKVVDDDKN